MRTSFRLVPTAVVVSATLLSACSKPQPSATVESLVADPDRLKQLRARCKAERSKVGNELCDRVAEASKLRFFWDGKVPYNPPKESPIF